MRKFRFSKIEKLLFSRPEVRREREFMKRLPPALQFCRKHQMTLKNFIFSKKRREANAVSNIHRRLFSAFSREKRERIYESVLSGERIIIAVPGDGQRWWKCFFYPQVFSPPQYRLFLLIFKSCEDKRKSLIHFTYFQIISPIFFFTLQ